MVRFLVFTLLVSACSGPSSSRTTLPMDPAASQCIVGEGVVRVNVLIPTTYENSEREERILWTIECLPGKWPVCNSVALRVSDIEESGQVTGNETYVFDFEVVELEGLYATLRWQDTEFRVDAEHGEVDFSGRIFGPQNGRGSAQCQDHGPPIGR